jgi:hypothetical protein
MFTEAPSKVRGRWEGGRPQVLGLGRRRLRLVRVTRRVQFTGGTLGEPETFTFLKRPVLDTRCRVQFETFQ